MAGYILMDNNSGYIFGDSADLEGRIFTGTPTEFAAALDATQGADDRKYEFINHNPRTTETGYHVYRADVGGSEAVPLVWDGQDQETIEAVERDCQYLGFIRVKSPIGDDLSAGTRVEAGEGDDYDTGTVIDAKGEDARHPMAGGDNVLVAWDSGTRTWTPASDLRRV